MKIKISALMTAALACTLALPAPAQDKDKDDKKPVAEKRENMAQHPEVASAMEHLREARETLQKASPEFGGHRAKALKHINEALEECRQALAFEKK